MSDDAIDFHDLLIRVSFCEVKLSHYSCPVTLTAAPIWEVALFKKKLTLYYQLILWATFEAVVQYQKYSISGILQQLQMLLIHLFYKSAKQFHVLSRKIILKQMYLHHIKLKSILQSKKTLKIARILKWKGNTLSHFTWEFMLLPSKAVGGSEDPRAVYQHASTHQSPVQPQVHQPWPAARRGRRSPHDTTARLCQVLCDWETLATHSYIKITSERIRI